MISDRYGRPFRTPTQDDVKGAVPLLLYTSDVQRILAVSSTVSRPSIGFIAVQGDDVELIVRKALPLLTMGMGPQDVPPPGFWVWEGVFKADRKPSESFAPGAFQMEGTWRPALLSDYRAFNFHDPAIGLTADAIQASVEIARGTSNDVHGDPASAALDFDRIAGMLAPAIGLEVQERERLAIESLKEDA